MKTNSWVTLDLDCFYPNSERSKFSLISFICFWSPVCAVCALHSMKFFRPSYYCVRPLYLEHKKQTVVFKICWGETIKRLFYSWIIFSHEWRISVVFLTIIAPKDKIVAAVITLQSFVSVTNRCAVFSVHCVFYLFVVLMISTDPCPPPPPQNKTEQCEIEV